MYDVPTISVSTQIMSLWTLPPPSMLWDPLAIYNTHCERLFLPTICFKTTSSREISLPSLLFCFSLKLSWIQYVLQKLYLCVNYLFHFHVIIRKIIAQQSFHHNLLWMNNYLRKIKKQITLWQKKNYMVEFIWGVGLMEPCISFLFRPEHKFWNVFGFGGD